MAVRAEGAWFHWAKSVRQLVDATIIFANNAGFAFRVVAVRRLV
jgi:hypothetical protein